MTLNNNILIVEDEYIIANDLRLLLQAVGYPVCGIAANIVEARHLIELFAPSMVLLDIILNDGTFGIDLADELNRKNIGFIYLSGSTRACLLHAASATGPDAILMKPFRNRELLSVLKRSTDKRRFER